MKSSIKVAVASRSFSKNPILRRELLEKFPNTTFNDAGKVFEGNELVAFLRGHERAITGLEKLTESVISQLPELKLISKYGVGMDMVDFAALERHGKLFAWTGGVNCRAVAELALSMMLVLIRKSYESCQDVKSGNWKQWIGNNLSGKNIGLIGIGHVGKDLIKLLKPFECQIRVYDVRSFPDFCEEHKVKPTSLEELLRESDVISVHVPLDESTRGMISSIQMAMMKPETVLINTARGGIIDEAALWDAMVNGHIAAAGFDVFAEEPPVSQDLISLKNFYCTSHIGGSSQEAILAMGRAAIDGLEKGHPPKRENFV